MKIYLLLLVASLCIAGCDNANYVPPAKQFTVQMPQRTLQVSVVVIDECEYLHGTFDRSAFLTHKGNCKYCAERADPGLTLREVEDTPEAAGERVRNMLHSLSAGTVLTEAMVKGIQDAIKEGEKK